jgi:hypothetical protein
VAARSPTPMSLAPRSVVEEYGTPVVVGKSRVGVPKNSRSDMELEGHMRSGAVSLQTTLPHPLFSLPTMTMGWWSVSS